MSEKLFLVHVARAVNKNELRDKEKTVKVPNPEQKKT